MDTKVTFKTAKLAKEVGFDLNTYSDCWVKTLDGKIIHNSERENRAEHDRCQQYIMQPTQTTLWKWMREKGIEVYPPLPYGDKWACSFIKTEDTQFFDTWEEALENELFNKLKKRK